MPIAPEDTMTEYTSVNGLLNNGGQILLQLAVIRSVKFTDPCSFFIDRDD